MDRLTLIFRGAKTPPVLFALEKLRRAAEARGLTIEEKPYWTDDPGQTILAAGLRGEPLIGTLTGRAGIDFPDGKEGIALFRTETDCGTPVSVASGTDETGLMYALTELAERLAAYGPEAVTDVTESVAFPAMENRVAGRFLYSRRDDGWFRSDEFWTYYIDRLAECRVNRLHFILGFDTAYMSPPYPFLFATPGFEEVEPVTDGDVVAERRENLAQIRRIGQLCHRRGLKFALGIWQQRPWTSNQAFMVRNCPEGDAFTRYVGESLKELLRLIPEIDILSLRVNPEAGIRTGTGFNTNTGFWGGVFQAMSEAQRKVPLELRAKGLTDGMIDYAQSLGFDVTVPTKAMCEHVGLPYMMLQLRGEELAHIDNENSTRRYSYDNLLRRPRSYHMQYRLWNYGSTNLFLWGQPDWTARFIRSCLNFQANGFEFTAPLTMKGGHALLGGGDFPIHVNDRMYTYRFEDERYWLYYRTFGRYSYDPDAGPEPFERALTVRFGAYADAMSRAYRASGWILPLITTAHFPEHPSMHWWPELYGSAALFWENNYEPYFTTAGNRRGKNSDYGNADPADETLFVSIERYAEGKLAGKVPHACSPLKVGDWYWALATRTMAAVKDLEGAEDPEIQASVVDFEMTARLGFYHAWMVQAAYRLELFRKTGKKEYLLPSYQAMANAYEEFAKLAQLGSKYYARNLEFDAGTSTKRNGNWQDRLDEQVRPDLWKLAGLLMENGVRPEPSDAPYESIAGSSPLSVSAQAVVPESWTAGEDMPVSLYLGCAEAVKAGETPYVRYRRATMRDGLFKALPMTFDGEAYTAVIPGGEITADYDLLVYFTFEDAFSDVRLVPGLLDTEENEPVFIVETGA